MKYLIKKCGTFFCRILLGLLQFEDGRLNPTKIALVVGTFTLYSLLISWKFALLVMVGIGWHESGHVWAMRKVGTETQGFYFVPFMGGVAIGDGKYKSLSDKIVVAIMGPAWGMGLAFVSWLVYLITDSQIWAVIAFWQAFFNLFNLTPVNPLDGGQIFRAILDSGNKTVADVFGFLSILLSILLTIIFKSPIFAIIAIFSAKDFWFQYKYGISAEVKKLSNVETIIAITSYLTLAAILYTIMSLSSVGGMSGINLFLR